MKKSNLPLTMTISLLLVKAIIPQCVIGSEGLRIKPSASDNKPYVYNQLLTINAVTSTSGGYSRPPYRH